MKTVTITEERYSFHISEIERLSRQNDELRKDVSAWYSEAELMRGDLAIYSEEIERLRKALQTIAKPSKIVAKEEDMVVALQVLLSSHRQTALKALEEKE